MRAGSGARKCSSLTHVGTTPFSAFIVVVRRPLQALIAQRQLIVVLLVLFLRYKYPPYDTSCPLTRLSTNSIGLKNLELISRKIR